MNTPANITIQTADPLSETATRLLAEFSADIAQRYADMGEGEPDSFNPAELLQPRHAFVLATRDGHPVGCGALCPLYTNTAEFRRIYVSPSARRLGLGRAILTELEKLAGVLGYQTIRLETGTRQPEAIALYERYGFHRIPAFGRYIGDPVSLCFEKPVKTGIRSL
ncbi:MAG TPA: GNAT family N-acetyltransferase [Verrucomicrobiae bacterium]